jgi:hypothetical protein
MDDASNAPCPGCGRTGTKLVHVPLAAKVTLKATLEATSKSSREFFAYRRSAVGSFHGGTGFHGGTKQYASTHGP